MDRQRPPKACLRRRRILEREFGGADDVAQGDRAGKARGEVAPGRRDGGMFAPVVGGLEGLERLDRRVAGPLDERFESRRDAPVLRELAEDLRIELGRGVELAALFELAGLGGRLVQLKSHRFLIVTGTGSEALTGGTCPRLAKRRCRSRDGMRRRSTGRQWPHRMAIGSSGRRWSMSSARVSGDRGGIGWRQKSEANTLPSTIAAFAARKPHWRFSWFTAGSSR